MRRGGRVAGGAGESRERGREEQEERRPELWTEQGNKRFVGFDWEVSRTRRWLSAEKNHACSASLYNCS